MNRLEIHAGHKSMSIRERIKLQINRIIDNRYLFLIFLPGFIYFIIFRYGPMYGLIIAFKSFKPALGIWGSPWAGLTYFQRMVNTSEFWSVFANTLIISAYKLVFYFPVPIILAMMLNEVRNMLYKRVCQTLMYLPYFVSWVIAAGLIMDFLSPDSGFVNYIIKALGGTPIYFLSKSEYFRSIVVLTSIWKYAGWGMIVYLAALAGIDVQMYEAAIIDGAGRFKQIVHITIPSIMNVIIILFILQIGYIMNADFEQILNLYNPLVFDVGDILDTYVYRIGLVSSSNMFSYAAAVGLLKSAIGLLLIIVTNKAARRITAGEIRIW